MMKTRTLMLTAAALLMIAPLGCKKYEDGPLLSLRSKDARVINNWRVGEAIDDGNDITDQFHRYDYDIDKDGKVTLSANYTFLGNDYVYVTTGDWAFLNKHTQLSFDYEDSDKNEDYIILRLKEDEMWLKEKDGTLELHLIPR